MLSQLDKMTFIRWELFLLNMSSFPSCLCLDSSYVVVFSCERSPWPSTKIIRHAHTTRSGQFRRWQYRLCLLHFQMKLNNLHFTYKLDLSRVPCHCNAAAYFNKMPAHSPGEGGDWYCDANYVGGIG